MRRPLSMQTMLECLNRKCCVAFAASILSISSLSQTAEAGFPQGVPVNLNMHEKGIGIANGHTIERHVNKSWSYIQNRCANKGPKSLISTFDGDEYVAQSWINDALRANLAQLSAILASGSPGLNRIEAPNLAWGYWWSNTGWAVDCGSTGSWFYTKGVRVIIGGDNRMPGGWYIVTSYPVPD